MRFATRGREGSIKTGILANLTISGIATLIYLLPIPLITAMLGISQFQMKTTPCVAVFNGGMYLAHVHQ